MDAGVRACMSSLASTILLSHHKIQPTAPAGVADGLKSRVILVW